MKEDYPQLLILPLNNKIETWNCQNTSHGMGNLSIDSTTKIDKPAAVQQLVGPTSTTIQPNVGMVPVRLRLVYSKDTHDSH